MPTADTIDFLQPFYLWDTTVEHTVHEVHEVNVGIPLDSIFRPVDTPEPQMRESLFTHHGMAVQHEQPVARHTDAVPAWTFVLLMLLTVLTFVYFTTRKIKLSELLKSTIDLHATERLVRSCNLGRIAMLLPAGLLMTSTMAMAVFTAAMTHTGLPGYLMLTAGISMAYLLRNIVMRLLGNVFNSKDTVSWYITNNYLYHLVLSTIMLPLLFLIVYLPWGNMVVLYIGIGIAILTFLARVARGTKIFLTISKNSSFYLFYYLCTVEIVPILVLIKLLIE